MTRPTNARIAGVTFLVYIAAGIASLVLAGRAHATDILSLLTSFAALVLGVTLYRSQDAGGRNSLNVREFRCRLRISNPSGTRRLW